LGFLSFLKSSDEFGFSFGGLGGVGVVHGHHGEAGGTRRFGLWDCSSFFGIGSKGFGFSECYGRLPHNFVADVGSESGDKEVEGDVVVGILDTEFDEVERDLGTDGNVGADNLRQSPQDGTKWVCQPVVGGGS
jgi:hypothetical protein